MVNALTFANATWVRVGFRTRGLSKSEVWVNGSLISTVSTGATTMPIVEMKAVLVCQSNGTTQPTVLIDYWCFAQVQQIALA